MWKPKNASILIFFLGFYREKWIYVHRESTREVSLHGVGRFLQSLWFLIDRQYIEKSVFAMWS